MCWREPKVTVYGKPNCNPCFGTTRKLDLVGVPFKYVDVTEDEEALAFVKDLGYTGSPVVVAEYPDSSVTHWTGYREDKIKGYARTVAAWSRGE